MNMVSEFIESYVRFSLIGNIFNSFILPLIVISATISYATDAITELIQ